MNYQIVIPSRKRSENMEEILEIFPRAIIAVHESEVDDYKTSAPQITLMAHSIKGNIGAIRNEILKKVPSECVIFCDDDLKWMWCMTGQRQRKTTDAEAIRQVIENALQCSLDLGIELFSFSRNRDPLQYFANRPFNLTGPSCRIFGIIGRRFKFDESLEWGEDIDMTLQHLLENRITLHDFRYYFDFGGVGEGAGGLQGKRTSDGRIRSVKLLSEKWGKHLNMEKRLKETSGMSIRVNRRAKIISEK